MYSPHYRVNCSDICTLGNTLPSSGWCSCSRSVDIGDEFIDNVKKWISNKSFKAIASSADGTVSALNRHSRAAVAEEKDMKYRIYVLLGLMLAMSACCTAPGGKTAGQKPIKPVSNSEQWLNAVVIEEVNFNAANLFDCIDFVQKQLDEYASHHKTKAPRFLYDAAAIRYIRKDAPLPTLNARKLTAFEVMKLLESIGRISFVPKPGQIIVVEKQ